MVKRRNKLDIVAEILDLAVDGIKRTGVVYLTNINFTMLRKYEKILIEKGFIEKLDGLLYTTDDGIKFLQKYRELMDAWKFIDANPSVTNNELHLDSEDKGKVSKLV